MDQLTMKNAQINESQNITSLKLASLRAKVEQERCNAYNAGQISEPEFFYYVYLIEDKSKNEFDYNSALDDLKKGSAGSYRVEIKEKAILVDYSNNKIFNARPLLKFIFENDPEEVAKSLDTMIFDFINLLACSEDNQLLPDQASTIYYMKSIRDAIRFGAAYGDNEQLNSKTSKS